RSREWGRKRHARRAEHHVARLSAAISFQRRAHQHEDFAAQRRRTEPGAARQNPEARRQRSNARRTDERSRSRNVTLARGSARRLRRLRHRGESRSLFFESRLYLDSRFRRRGPRGLSRRELRLLPGKTRRTRPGSRFRPRAGRSRRRAKEKQRKTEKAQVEGRARMGIDGGDYSRG